MNTPNWLYPLAKVNVRVGSDVYEGTVQKITPSGNQVLVAYGARLEVERFHRDGKGVYRIPGARLCEYKPEAVGYDPSF